ncbi:UNVERIFIED_CONTAM: hypothetical protein Cloal_0206 [Acetivibrio alkalicellulosi]
MKDNINPEKETDRINKSDVIRSRVFNSDMCKGCPYKFSTNSPSCIFPVSHSDECFWRYYKRFMSRNKKYI